MKAQPVGYSYIRFSSKSQERGHSKKRQEDMCRKWCEENGVRLAQTYPDLGTSAYRSTNLAKGSALAKFLDHVKDGRIARGSYLIVESLDRLSRDTARKAQKLFLEIIDAGIAVVTLIDSPKVFTQASIDKNPMDLMFTILIMMRANEESKTKGERSKRSWDAKRANLGKVKATAHCPGWLVLSDDRTKFKPIPARVAVVRKMFKLAASGIGPNAIARKLRRDGVECWGTSGKWNSAYIRIVLDGRHVLGEYRPSEFIDGERIWLKPIPDYFPRVVDPKLYATVLNIRKDRPKGAGRKGRFPFTKLVFDRDRGCPVHFITSMNNGRRYSYLISADALRADGDCFRATWRYEKFLGAFLAVTQKASLQDAQARQQDTGKLDLLKMELDDTRRDLGNVVKFIRQGIDSPTLKTELATLEAQQRRLEQEIADAGVEMQADPARIESIDWRDTERLRENLTATVRRITVDAASKWFKAEFLDGRTYTFQQDGDKVTITTPDKSARLKPIRSKAKK